MVGEAAGAAAKENERPVVELPKVRGSAVVWRVSLGRDVMVVVASGERHDMVRGRCKCKNSSQKLQRKTKSRKAKEKRKRKEKAGRRLKEGGWRCDDVIYICIRQSIIVMVIYYNT